MRFLQGLKKQSADFIVTHKQKLLLARVYAIYALIIGVLYMGNAALDVHRGKSAAYAVAQDFVARKLVSPSSAVFPPSSEDAVTVAYLGGNRYRVDGYLYSKNTFGNPQRSDYWCVVRNTGSGEWTYENILFK